MLWLAEGAPSSPCPALATADAAVAADAMPTVPARGDSKRAPASKDDSSANKVRGDTTSETQLRLPPRGTPALPITVRPWSLSSPITVRYGTVGTVMVMVTVIVTRRPARKHTLCSLACSPASSAGLAWPQKLVMRLQLRPDAPTFTPPSERGKEREGRAAAAPAERDRDRPAKRARTSDVRTG